jgi:hypothetical protein
MYSLVDDDENEPLMDLYCKNNWYNDAMLVFSNEELEQKDMTRVGFEPTPLSRHGDSCDTIGIRLT